MNTLTIESLDQEGRGVAHHDGKVIFVEGGLPGEMVVASVYRKKPSFELATLMRVVRESAARQTAHCAYFGRCGGCSLQHTDVRTQVAGKQRVLEDNLRHLGKVIPEVIFPAIHGPAWCYQPIGLAGHGRNDHNHLVPTSLPFRDAPGDVLDALRAADGRAAVFLND
jgi:23S rRNA (uracil1939-C5)-methyltransferase